MVRRAPTHELTASEVRELQDLLRVAFREGSEKFTDQDWDHAVGGVHFVLEGGGGIVAHASVVERELHTGGHRLATGYVEAMATASVHQRRGHGSALMREVDAYIDRTFSLGALDTGRTAFYERLGWVVWKGPTFVRMDTGLVRTADEDGYVMVRFTPTSPRLDVAAPISCDWRPGDVW